MILTTTNLKSNMETASNLAARMIKLDLFMHDETMKKSKIRCILSQFSCSDMMCLFCRYLDYALAHNSTDMFVTIAKRREARKVWLYIWENWGAFMDGNKTR